MYLPVILWTPFLQLCTAFVSPSVMREALKPPSLLFQQSAESSVASTSPTNDDAIPEGTTEYLAALSDEEHTFTNNPTEDPTEQDLFDAAQMRIAIELAQSGSGERSASSPFPGPVAGAVIVTNDGRILGRGCSDYQKHAVLNAVIDAGLIATPLSDWVVTWPSSKELRQNLADSTLYLTMEPTNQSKQLPPMTQLIQQTGIPRVVIGCPDPVMERATMGAAELYAAGLSVSMGVAQQDCEKLISEYKKLVASKLQKMARRHYEKYNVPLGFLHCSVVGSDNVDAFARQGNAFGKDFGGMRLGYRDFGSYGIAPPPDVVWADDTSDEAQDSNVDSILQVDFLEEEEEELIERSPMMPWYEQVDAVVATFPREGNGPADNDSVAARLSGLNWLATQGESLPASVERILVMDATDLRDLPTSNDDPNLPRGVDIEAFWRGQNRKKSRILLRRGQNAQARAAAQSAAEAAKAAAAAAEAAFDAVESGDAERAAEAALELQEAATAATQLIQNELAKAQELKRRLQDMGVVVETLAGGEVLDVMKHLGTRSRYESVVWRAGCWGERGVKAILDGAFQMVSAHLAVDAVGGKFWQLMLAERAVQAACGPERKVKVFADQEDISLEYCDELDADNDCVLTVDGKPIRHVRLDCRVALVDENRPREFKPAKTIPMTKKLIEEEAPWFL